MQEFEVEVEKIFQRIVKVRADSREDAIKKVIQMYKKEEIVLDVDDFISVDFR